MTRTTNARIAGSTFLFYIATGITSLVLSGRAISGEGIAEKFASIAQHAMEMRIVVLLSLLMCFSAVVLGVTLHAITREQDRDLAMLGDSVNWLSAVTWLMWLPMLVYEVALSAWLLIKGVAMPTAATVR